MLRAEDDDEDEEGARIRRKGEGDERKGGGIERSGGKAKKNESDALQVQLKLRRFSFRSPFG